MPVPFKQRRVDVNRLAPAVLNQLHPACFYQFIHGTIQRCFLAQVFRCRVALHAWRSNLRTYLLPIPKQKSGRTRSQSVAIFRATRNGVRPISVANNGAPAIAFGGPRSSCVRPGAHSARYQDSRNDLTPCRMAWHFVSTGAHAPHSDQTFGSTPTRGRRTPLGAYAPSLSLCSSIEIVKTVIGHKNAARELARKTILGAAPVEDNSDVTEFLGTVYDLI